MMETEIRCWPHRVGSNRANADPNHWAFVVMNSFLVSLELP